MEDEQFQEEEPHHQHFSEDEQQNDADAQVLLAVVAPGGPSVEIAGSAAGGGHAMAHSHHSAAGGADDDLASLCVICLTPWRNAAIEAEDQEIWHCKTCFHVVHMNCMLEWMRQTELVQVFGRCPTCGTSTNCTSSDLTYKCFCEKITWIDQPHLTPTNSCGMQCGRSRANGCPHACETVCHEGRCAPCQHVRADVSCPQNHQVFPPFQCGTEVPKCDKICNSVMACGHPCGAVCHEGPHPVCPVPVLKSCVCGKCINSIQAPCGQEIVQCESICGKSRSCAIHLCDRKCHAGDCAEVMLVSAWNKNSWIKIPSASASSSAAPAPSPSPVTSPWSSVASPSVSAANLAAFPAMSPSSAPPSAPMSRASSGSSTSSSSAVAAAASPAIQQAIATLKFQTCGKICGQIRSCGHACTQKCHPLYAEPELPSNAINQAAASLVALNRQESKEDDGESQFSSNLAPPQLQLSPSSSSSASSPIPRSLLCDSTRCLALVNAHCRCGRKTAKLKCFEAASPENRHRFDCDTACAAHKHGKQFQRESEQISWELCAGNVEPQSQPASIPSETPVKMLFLPYSRHMLSILSTNASGLESTFIKKTESAVQRFCLNLVNSIDAHETYTFNQTLAATQKMMQGSPMHRLPSSSPSSSSFASKPAAPVRNLYLTDLSATRRLFVSQFAFDYNLFFNQDSASLEFISKGSHKTSMIDSRELVQLFPSRQASDQDAAAPELQEQKEMEEALINGEHKFTESMLEMGKKDSSIVRLSASQVQLSPDTQRHMEIVAAFHKHGGVVLPSISATAAAALLADPSKWAGLSFSASSSFASVVAGAETSPPLPVVFTADEWPTSLRILFRFTSEDSDLHSSNERAGILQHIFHPFLPLVKLVYLDTTTIVALFVNPATARRAYRWASIKHAADLSALHVACEPPSRIGAVVPGAFGLMSQPSSSASASAAASVSSHVEAKQLAMEEEKEKEENRIRAAQARQASQLEFDQLQHRNARIKAATVVTSQSVLETAKKARAKKQVRMVTEGKTGLAKLKIQSNNAFDLLLDEEDE